MSLILRVFYDYSHCQPLSHVTGQPYASVWRRSKLQKDYFPGIRQRMANYGFSTIGYRTAAPPSSHIGDILRGSVLWIAGRGQASPIDTTFQNTTAPMPFKKPSVATASVTTIPVTSASAFIVVSVAYGERLSCTEYSAIPKWSREKSTDISSQRRTELSKPLWGLCAGLYGARAQTRTWRRFVNAQRGMRAAICRASFRSRRASLSRSTSSLCAPSNKEAA